MYYQTYIKPAFDRIFALILLIILCPLLFIISFLIIYNLGTPVIFKQKRPGLREDIFTLYKFRTMKDVYLSDGKMLPDSERLTNFGRILRSTSLDELPELINILKGDMSFIGPRPLSVKYLNYYTEEEKLRHSIKPGISGLAQVNGRNILGWEQRFEYDIKYIQNISFFLDIKIIYKTVIKIFKRDDIGERGIDAPEDFDIYRMNQINNERKL